MDFLDEQFASVNRATYNEFLGLGNNKQKATAQNSYEQDLLNRFPFTTDCEEQKKIIAAMYKESAETLQMRNDAKKNSGYRNDLTGKLRAFDAYIPEAVNFLNTVSCVGGSTTPDTSTSPPATAPAPATTPAPDVLASTVIPTATTPGTPAAAVTATGLLAKMGPNAKKYALFGGGLILLVGGILLVKHIRK